MSFVPRRSPFSLIQEDLFPDRWKILVACICLNQTSRKQVEKVLPTFFEKWNSAENLVVSDIQDVIRVIKPLGLSSKRASSLMKMSKAFITQAWKDPRELPGVGEYAARSWEIFCEGKLGDQPPKDHALVAYHNWAKNEEQKMTQAKEEEELGCSWDDFDPKRWGNEGQTNAE